MIRHGTVRYDMLWCVCICVDVETNKQIEIQNDFLPPGVHILYKQYSFIIISHSNAPPHPILSYTILHHSYMDHAYNYSSQNSETLETKQNKTKTNCTVPKTGTVELSGMSQERKTAAQQMSRIIERIPSMSNGFSIDGQGRSE